MPKVLLLMLALLAGSCAVQKTICPCDAPSRLLLEGSELELTGEAERPSDTSAMVLELQLAALNQSILPQGIVVREYFIRPSDLSFEAARGVFEEQVYDASASLLLLRTRDAPKWPAGISIDIAVHFTDRQGKSFFLKVDKVII